MVGETQTTATKRRGSMNTTDKCGKSKQADNLGDDGIWINCEHCRRCFHAFCADISKELFLLIKPINKSSVRKKLQADYIDYDSLKNDIISSVTEALASSLANEQQQRNYADATASEATGAQVARTTHVQNYVSQRNQYEICIDEISKLDAPNAAEQIQNDRQTISNMLTYLDEGHELGHIDNIERLLRFDMKTKTATNNSRKVQNRICPKKDISESVSDGRL